MSAFNIIVWNCRGAGNDRFKLNFADLFNSHKPDVVALLETKVSTSSMRLFFSNLGLTESICVDPSGRSGGVWVIWDPRKVTVTTIKVATQVIHVNVKKTSLRIGSYQLFMLVPIRVIERFCGQYAKHCRVYHQTMDGNRGLQ